MLPGVLAALCLGAAPSAASTTGLVGDAINAFDVVNNVQTPLPGPDDDPTTPIVVTDDTSDTFRYGFRLERFDVNVDAFSVTLTHIFAGEGIYPTSTPCNCLLLTDLNFHDGALIDSVTVDSATGNFDPFQTSRVEFGEDVDAASPASFLRIDVGGLELFEDDSVTLSFTTTAAEPGAEVIPLPASAWLLLAGTGGLFGLRRRTRA
ncbi:MAG: VPLPA-CTERM sorting domain-containing protein [Roseicyclus sp.]